MCPQRFPWSLPRQAVSQHRQRRDANLNEITNVRDVTLNLETGEADVSTRGNGGRRANIATLIGATFEFEMIRDTADDDITAIREAFS